jgi:hypothetical protein
MESWNVVKITKEFPPKQPQYGTRHPLNNWIDWHMSPPSQMKEREVFPRALC